MKVNYSEINFITEAKSDIVFLKNNNLWYFFSQQCKSRYFGGYLFYNNQAIKFIDQIIFPSQVKEFQILSPDKIILKFNYSQCLIELTESSLIINFSNWENIHLIFDIKQIFDNNPFKRAINITPLTTNSFVIKELFDNFEVILNIEADAPLKINNIWQKNEMNFDQERNSPPFQWWTYNGLEGKVRELKINLLYPTLKLSLNKKIFLSTSNKLKNFFLQRLNSFILDSYLAAGFPWFFENWYRDELLTFYLLKNFFDKNFLAKRLAYYLTNLDYIWDKNKTSQASPASDILLLLITCLDHQSILTNYQLIEKYFSFWEKEFLKDGEMNLPPFSTWMDTQNRSKAIEIYALYLKALRQLSEVNKNFIQKTNYFKKKIINEINQKIFDVNLIFVFLFLPDIFSRRKWINLFDKLIEKFYLDWGGLSTLAKDDHNFQKEDKGEKSLAYHSGDSWYYLNNIFVQALNIIGVRKFKPIMNQIIMSSLEDILIDGALGFASEVSDAKERTSKGALVQLWSLSSFLSLLTSFKNIDIFLKALGNSHNIVTIET